ncbi:hypothetical protein SLEP1_g7475 [Rubroshorea leprosula]|uniref:Uncharacterized protein n=1 Tax=Rubroshorea leprosula TaxID=152421 RepID=A0AAV5I9D8_9ROSI|nr:hypothetical protein SLEP1_g7475 [Rubroshorea leprosula]
MFGELNAMSVCYVSHLVIPFSVYFLGKQKCLVNLTILGFSRKQKYWVNLAIW